MGRTDEAVATVEAALALEASNADVLNDRGVALRVANRPLDDQTQGVAAPSQAWPASHGNGGDCSRRRRLEAGGLGSISMTPLSDRRRDSRSAAQPRHGLLVAMAAAGLLAATNYAASAQATRAAPAKAAAPPVAVAPPVATDPASTSATYGDWVLRCQRVGEADKALRLCEVSQTIQAQNQRDPIAQVAFGRLPNDPALRLTVALPPSVSFPSTVEVTSAAPVMTASLQWKRCLPGGCYADAVPGDDVVKAWRGLVTAGKLDFKDAGGHDIVLPVSFRGLSQALDALGK